MKKLSLSLILIAVISASSFAQEQSVQTSSTSSQKKNEMGIFMGTQFDNGSNDNFGVMMGIKYKKWIKPNIGIRIMGGINPLYNSRDPRIIENTGKDTVLVGFHNYDVNVYFLGLGLEAQRHFYKKVFLYASVDVVGGYGEGYEQKYSILNSIYHINYGFINPNSLDFVEKSYSKGYVKVLPNIGGKLVFKRFVVGAELNAMNFGWFTEKTGFSPNQSFSILDFNLLTPVSYRILFNYRF